MRYPFPPLHRIPASLADEMRQTSPEEWDRLIADIVSAIDTGKPDTFIMAKVVQTGWSEPFASYALAWAHDEIAIRDVGDKGQQDRDPAPGSDADGLQAWETFVRRMDAEPYRSDGPGAVERLLRTPVDSRVWKPWEVVALDTEFRVRLLSAQNADCLSDFAGELRQALGLLRLAGINQGESKLGQSSFEPIFDDSGSVLWFAGVFEHGFGEAPSVRSQSRHNEDHLGQFHHWYVTAGARSWLSGIDREGPVDLSELMGLLAQADAATPSETDREAFLTWLQIQVKPHTGVAAVRWLADTLNITYYGPTPTTSMRHMINCNSAQGFGRYIFVAGALLGIVGGLAFRIDSTSGLMMASGAGAGLAALYLFYLCRPERAYWQRWPR